MHWFVINRVYYIKFSGFEIVHLYYIGFIALSKMAVVMLPLPCFATGLLLPCIPPVWSSVIYLECNSWDDDGNSGFIFRMYGAILCYYLGFSVISTGVFVITVVMIYPAEVKLILIESISRFHEDKTQNDHPNFPHMKS